MSYNVQEVKSEELLTNKDANFINALSGKVAGVTINSSSSGVGGASKVVMRGTEGFDQSSNALYVIDGVPMFQFQGVKEDKVTIQKVVRKPLLTSILKILNLCLF